MCPFLLAQTVRNLPTMWETWVRSLGWEDPLEEGMAAHSSILAWRIPQRSLMGYSPWVRKESDTTETKHSTPKCSPKCIISVIFTAALIGGMTETPSSPFSLNNTPSDVYMAMWNRHHISKLPQ